MTDWKPIKTAPHDVPVRIKTEDGSVTRAMKFTPPHWWDAPQGIIRLADGHLYAGSEITKAVSWREAT